MNLELRSRNQKTKTKAFTAESAEDTEKSD